MDTLNTRDGYVSVNGATEYLSLSERTIRGHLREIPHYRIGNGKILFRYSELDAWMEQFRVRRDGPDLDQIAEEAVKDIL